ncbi:MAG: radical SAM protein, partial [Eubacteriales bacterium]
MAQAYKNLGIYIHVPFCAHKCAYCDFYSITDKSPMNEYVLALTDQIYSKKNIAKNYTVDTVYIGGGTPSILPARYIEKILDALRDTFRISPNAEITIEANPGTLDGEKLA